MDEGAKASNRATYRNASSGSYQVQWGTLRTGQYSLSAIGYASRHRFAEVQTKDLNLTCSQEGRQVIRNSQENVNSLDLCQTGRNLVKYS